MAEETIVRFEDVSFEHGPRKHILDEVSFPIRRGAKLTLMGQNGAGKSTLFGLITGAIKPESGDIHIEKGLSIVFARQVIPRDELKLTVREFFQKVFPKKMYDIDPRIDDVLEVVNLKGHEKVHDRFLAMFLNAARSLKVGNGLAKATQMGPVINEAQMKKVLGYIETGRKEGAQLALGGQSMREGALAKGFFIEPTVFIGVDEEMRIAQEEIFGPVVSVLKAKSLEDAIAMANNVKYGLSSSIYTQDVNNSAIAERDLDAGIVYINAPTIGAEIQLPFGGVKKSGLGRKEAGGRGGSLDMFTRWKVIYRDFSGRLQKAQIDTD